jgi:translation initiation factor IF-2
MDKQQEALSKEKEKMMVEGTKPSTVTVIEAGTPLPEPAPLTDTPPAVAGAGYGPKTAPDPVRTYTLPSGVSLVEEPRIVSEAGLLLVEPREVSTGGVKHPETEPTSLTPGHETPPPPEPEPAPEIKTRAPVSPAAAPAPVPTPAAPAAAAPAAAAPAAPKAPPKAP